MFQVTLRRLEVFLAVIESGSFSRAADALDIAQPSVSVHIRSLEREVGGPVFVRRRGSRPILTDLGRSVEEHARHLLAEADDLQTDILSIRDAAATRVVLACQRSLANFGLRKPLTDFALSRPDIQLAVRIGKQEDVLSEVRDGIADLGCFLSNEETRGLATQVIGAQRLRLAAAPDHPLVGRRVAPAEIVRYGFVGPPPGSLFGRAVTRLLAGIGIVGFKTVAQATEYHFLRELVAAGVGISCSPETSIDADVKAGLLGVIDLDAPDLLLQIRLIYSAHRAATQGMHELRDHLCANTPSI